MSSRSQKRIRGCLFAVRVTEAELADVRTAATASGLSVGAWVRRAVVHELRHAAVAAGTLAIIEAAQSIPADYRAELGLFSKDLAR